MYNHFVAVDWAMSNMAIARMTSKSNKISVIDVPADIKELQLYLKNLNGSVCLAIEETTTSRWIYTEVKSCVDKLIVCDPYRNKLLNEGPKNDKIDASKLVQLLKAELLKEVFHSNDKFIELRKLVSGYEDLIKMGVRCKNQRSALFRAYNMNHKTGKVLTGAMETFVLTGLDKQINYYEKEKDRYQREFKRLSKRHSEIKRVSDIPGIGIINAVKIVARVVDAKRFATRNHFISYCGLVRHEKISGGRSYGKKIPRYSRIMKSVFKSAVIASIDGDNQFGDQYHYLIDKKGYSERNARQKIARQIATTTYGVLKGNNKYKPIRKRISYVDKL